MPLFMELTDAPATVSGNELVCVVDPALAKPARKRKLSTLLTYIFPQVLRDKLDGIQAGATANQTDAYLLDRANHTGAQATSTVTGLDTQLPRIGGGNFVLLTAASGTWTVPAGVTEIEVRVQAAGGGAGGVAAAVGSTAGAGSGEYIVARCAVLPGQQIAYSQDNVGGAGGAAGNNAGSNGGNSIFGGVGSTSTFGTITATGGFGSAGSASGNGAATPVNTVNAARHGVAPTADLAYLLTLIGNGGTGSGSMGGTGGFAPSAWCEIAMGPPVSDDGTNAVGYGGGGSGALSTSTSSPYKGGNGAPGAIVISYR